MKVLVVHNRYRSDTPSGENVVVDREVTQLRGAGLTVETYFRSSDELASWGRSAKIRLPLAPLTGWPSLDELRAQIQRLSPDVIHLHNPYPLVSPMIIRVSSELGVPIVVTLHNFRISCANGLFFRDGEVCTECEGRKIPWPAVRHGCYRDSRLQSAGMATALVRHRPTWGNASALVCLSEFQAERLRGWGLDVNRIHVKPNSVDDPGPVGSPGKGFLYVGRLSPEKGPIELLQAWAASGLGADHRLLIVGAGPLEAEVRRQAAAMPGVEVLGSRTPEEVVELRRATGVAVVPSECFEVNPLSVLESFAAGRAVVTTSIGSMQELVDDEVGWNPSRGPGALERALWSAVDREALESRGGAARRRYQSRYHPNVLTSKLVEIYESVVR